MYAERGTTRSATRTLRLLAVGVAAIGLWLVSSSMPAEAKTAPTKSLSSHYTARTPHKSTGSSSSGSAASDAAAAVAPPPLYTQCPAVGLNTGCALLIVINPDGSVIILVDPDQSTTYDGSEDTLIGVQNNSNSFVQSLDLASTSDAFGFDEDGVCDLGTDPTFPNAPGCAQGTFTDDAGNPAFGQTGYEGPFTMFTNISTDFTSGTVVFTNPPSGGGAGCGFTTPQPGLAPGASAYFGLEEQIDVSNLALTGVPVSNPCPPPPVVQATNDTQGPALARTGQNTDMMVRLALLLLVSGAVLIAFSRRLAQPIGVHAAR